MSSIRSHRLNIVIFAEQSKLRGATLSVFSLLDPCIFHSTRSQIPSLPILLLFRVDVIVTVASLLVYRRKDKELCVWRQILVIYTNVYAEAPVN